MKFGSWTYHKAEVNVVDKSFDGRDAFSFEHFLDKSVEILEHSVERKEKTYPCCPGEIYPSLDFK